MCKTAEFPAVENGNTLIRIKSYYSLHILSDTERFFVQTKKATKLQYTKESMNAPVEHK